MLKSLFLKSKLTITQVFYFAAFIHLVFVNIHLFVDGNGRITRLIEKWFLAKKPGDHAWFITSEKNYWDNRPSYYKNLQIGVNYYEVKYEKILPFLLMLPNSLKKKVWKYLPMMYYSKLCEERSSALNQKDKRHKFILRVTKVQPSALYSLLSYGWTVTNLLHKKIYRH